MSKMAECNMYPNLSPSPSNEQQFRLNKINEIKDYFVAEIKERELKDLESMSLLLTILISH